jgi:hypothetical protein
MRARKVKEETMFPDKTASLVVRGQDGQFMMPISGTGQGMMEQHRMRANTVGSRSVAKER